MRLTLFASLALSGLGLSVNTEACQPSTQLAPALIGHRGLMVDAPENTLAGFRCCLQLKVGFELDIRRSKDGRLVCIHDDTVDRTCDGKGKVADLTFAQLRKLDAGVRFDKAFAGERAPTLEEVFALLKDLAFDGVVVALDFKIDDETVEADVVALANQYGVLKHVLCIGRTISEPSVRRKLKAADARTPVAVLAQTPADADKALRDKDADWIYVRFVPTADQVTTMHKAEKRVFLAGPTVAGIEPGNWSKAKAAGVDAILTDYPLECRRSWRAGK